MQKKVVKCVANQPIPDLRSFSEYQKTAYVSNEEVPCHVMRLHFDSWEWKVRGHYDGGTVNPGRWGTSGHSCQAQYRGAPKPTEMGIGEGEAVEWEGGEGFSRKKFWTIFKALLGVQKESMFQIISNEQNQYLENAFGDLENKPGAWDLGTWDLETWDWKSSFLQNFQKEKSLPFQSAPLKKMVNSEQGHHP